MDRGGPFKVFVGGLPQDCTNDILVDYFGKFGFGFVSFDTEEAVDSIMAMHNQHQIQDKWVDCKRATAEGTKGVPQKGSGGGGKGTGSTRPPAARAPSYNAAPPPDYSASSCSSSYGGDAFGGYGAYGAGAYGYDGLYGAYGGKAYGGGGCNGHGGYAPSKGWLGGKGSAAQSFHCRSVRSVLRNSASAAFVQQLQIKRAACLRRRPDSKQVSRRVRKSRKMEELKGLKQLVPRSLKRMNEAIPSLPHHGKERVW
ncbi:DAZ-associated protein 1 [Symbiodinium microadriaticum]|uniref:DAZ-associated protein 1 n=1 Tax=Symbiodinium microadriaticum TaxID=2951 RepID=A0A1Q9DM50_SYMMI|nr:DAZ-associated protein 1 [Symbiodinium microadriaticum]